MDNFEWYIIKNIGETEPGPRNVARLAEFLFDLHTHANGVPEFPDWEVLRVSKDGAVFAPLPWKFGYQLKVTEGAWRVFFEYADNNGLYAGRGPNFRGRVSFKNDR